MNWILLLGTLAVFLVAFSSWRYFVRPTTDRPQSADAIVLFAGGRGERLEVALELLEDGVARHLVLPNGNLPNWDDANQLCDGEWDFEVHCFAPDPDNTWGEASGVGELAVENGWDRLVGVTSTYHVHRVRLLLGRCFDGSIDMVAAPPDLTAYEWSTRVFHEWVGTAAARTFRRGC